MPVRIDCIAKQIDNIILSVVVKKIPGLPFTCEFPINIYNLLFCSYNSELRAVNFVPKIHFILLFSLRFINHVSNLNSKRWIYFGDDRGHYNSIYADNSSCHIECPLLSTVVIIDISKSETSLRVKIIFHAVILIFMFVFIQLLCILTVFVILTGIIYVFFFCL